MSGGGIGRGKWSYNIDRRHVGGGGGASYSGRDNPGSFWTKIDKIKQVIKVHTADSKDDVV